MHSVVDNSGVDEEEEEEEVEAAPVPDSVVEYAISSVWRSMCRFRSLSHIPDLNPLRIVLVCWSPFIELTARMFPCKHSGARDGDSI